MADISVLIKGNPKANDGLLKLVTKNNPTFSIEDKTYPGFAQCPYFFSIKIEGTQVIYKLVFNGECVKSRDASRPGALIISIAIPQGYKLAGGKTPYDVLYRFKEIFFEKGMVCKDSTRDIYEYKLETSQYGNIIDDVLCEFRLEQWRVTYKVMTPSGPVGLITLQEGRMKELFNDIRYAEFASCSEVLVATHCSNQSQYRMLSLAIPREKRYKIYKDLSNMPCRKVTSLEEKVTISSDKDEKYFETKTISFTIAQLLNGDNPPGVTLDEDKEEVRVSTESLATPREKEVNIRIDSSRYQLYKYLTLENSTGATIELKNDLSFILSGQGISDFDNKRIRLNLSSQAKCEIIKEDYSANEIIITVQDKQPKLEINNINTNSDKHTSKQDSKDLVIKIGNIFSSKNSSSKKLRVRLKWGKNEGFGDYRMGNYFFMQMVTFSKASDEGYEGHFYKPDVSYDLVDLVIETNEKKCTKDITNLNNGGIIDIKNSDWKKRSFIDRHKKLFKWLCLPLIVLILGMIVGYAVHEPLNRLFRNEQNSESRESGNSDEKEKEEARRFLNDAGEKLRTKEVTFAQIGEIYEEYKQKEQIYNKCDSDMSNCKICSLIRDTKLMSDAIQSGKTDSIGSYLEKHDGNEFNLYDIHAKPCEQIVKDKQSVERFKNWMEKNTLERFADIEKIYQYRCDQCKSIKWFDSQDALDSHIQSKHSPSQQVTGQEQNNNSSKSTLTNATPQKNREQTRFTCNKCGAGTWFFTQKELDDHTKSKHER